MLQQQEHTQTTTRPLLAQLTDVHCHPNEAFEGEDMGRAASEVGQLAVGKVRIFIYLFRERQELIVDGFAELGLCHVIIPPIVRQNRRAIPTRTAESGTRDGCASVVCMDD